MNCLKQSQAVSELIFLRIYPVQPTLLLIKVDQKPMFYVCYRVMENLSLLPQEYWDRESRTSARYYV